MAQNELLHEQKANDAIRALPDRISMQGHLERIGQLHVVVLPSDIEALSSSRGGS